MKVTLKKTIFENFKGIRNLEVNFNPDVTNIFGFHRTGKTTLSHSFPWSIIGKDRLDRKDFEIKTLDANNNPMHKLDHGVTQYFDVDGQEMVIKRVFKEQWGKVKGEEKETLISHKTDFYINHTKQQTAGEFNSKMREFFGDEETFKILTDPLFFCSDVPGKWGWKNRRKLIEGLIENFPSDSQIAQGDDELVIMLKKITSVNSVNEYLLGLKAKESQLKKDITEKNISIKERGKETIKEPDYQAVQKELDWINTEILRIEQQIADKTKPLQDYNVVISNYTEKNGPLVTRKSLIESNAITSANESNKNNAYLIAELERIISEAPDKLITLQDELKVLKEEETKLKTSVKSIQDEWSRKNSETFVLDEDSTKCFNCDAELEGEKLEKVKQDSLKNFNISKESSLLNIQRKGLSEKEKVGLKAKAIAEKETEISDLNNDVFESSDLLVIAKTYIQKTSEDYLEDNKEYAKLKEDIVELDKTIANPPVINTDELTAKKTELSGKTTPLIEKLAIKNTVIANDKRLEELQLEQSNLVEKLSGIQKEIDVVKRFNKKKIDLVEGPINSMFPTIRWRLFKMQMNDEINDDVCDALIDGVPFNSANEADKHKAGLEIISVFSKSKDKYLPVFMDNRESVLYDIKSESQIINLRVSSDKTLTVE